MYMFLTQQYHTPFFFFNDPATTEIYALSLHDALPICLRGRRARRHRLGLGVDLHRDARQRRRRIELGLHLGPHAQRRERSEEHTSELQSRQYLVCRLLLEKKKIIRVNIERAQL